MIIILFYIFLYCIGLNFTRRYTRWSVFFYWWISVSFFLLSISPFYFWDRYWERLLMTTFPYILIFYLCLHFFILIVFLKIWYIVDKSECDHAFEALAWRREVRIDNFFANKNLTTAHIGKNELFLFKKKKFLITFLYLFFFWYRLVFFITLLALIYIFHFSNYFLFILKLNIYLKSNWPFFLCFFFILFFFRSVFMMFSGLRSGFTTFFWTLDFTTGLIYRPYWDVSGYSLYWSMPYYKSYLSYTGLDKTIDTYGLGFEYDILSGNEYGGMFDRLYRCDFNHPYVSKIYGVPGHWATVNAPVNDAYYNNFFAKKMDFFFRLFLFLITGYGLRYRILSWWKGDGFIECFEWKLKKKYVKKGQ